jgi:NADPH:quinone reductase-like Zn-dependent oxidoreductase
VAGDEVSADALWYVGPGRAEIREERLKPLTSGKVRVRALYGAISRGTEALIAAGRVPVSEYQRMRAPFMAGNFPFPVKYGYSTIGRVEAGPDGLLGRNVFALHPHQNLFDVPEDFAVPVPAEITLSRAVMAANMETALNATWDAAPGPFGRIAVIGAGVVGALVAFLCARIEGTEVTLVDIDRSREALAATLGVGFAAPDAAPADCNFVFHTSASAEGLTTALNISGIVAVPLGGAFHSRRLKLISSQVGKVAPSQRAKFTHRQRLEAAIKLTAHPHLDALLTPAVSFRELPTVLPDILKPRSGVLCQLISY